MLAPPTLIAAAIAQHNMPLTAMPALPADTSRAHPHRRPSYITKRVTELGPGDEQPQWDQEAGVQLVPKYGDCSPFSASDFSGKGKQRGVVVRSLDALRGKPGGEVRDWAAGVAWCWGGGGGGACCLRHEQATASCSEYAAVCGADMCAALPLKSSSGSMVHTHAGIRQAGAEAIQKPGAPCSLTLRVTSGTCRTFCPAGCWRSSSW
jgi:hypothetical protein